MNTYSRYIALTTCAALLCSCAEMSDGARTRGEGTGAGAGLGGLLGAAMGLAIGGKTESVVTGALAGAAAGGVGGYFYGDSVAKKKAAYKQAEDTYRKTIADLDQKISINENNIAWMKNESRSLAQMNKKLSRTKYNNIAAQVNENISILRKDADFAYKAAESIDDQAQKNAYISRGASMTRLANSLEYELNTLNRYTN